MNEVRNDDWKKKSAIWAVSFVLLVLLLVLFRHCLQNPVSTVTGTFSLVMVWLVCMTVIPYFQKGDLQDWIHQKNHVIFFLLFMFLMVLTGFDIFHHHSSVSLRNVSIALITVLFVSGVLTELGLERKRISFVKAFVILASVLGLSYDFVMPVGEAPDEWVHFQTAYLISNEMMGIDENKDPRDIYMRKDDARFEIMQTDVTEQKYEKYLLSATEPLKNDHIVRCESKALHGDEYLYVLPALGITIGRMFHLNSYWVINMGRFGNLFLSVLITAIAISLIPVGKRILMVTYFIPTALQQNMSYSYDVAINAFSFLVLAVSVKLLTDSEWRMKIWTGVLTCMGVFVLIMGKRHAYFLMGLLPVFAWINARMKMDQKRKDQIMKRIVIVILILIGLVLLFFFSGAALKVIPESHHMVYWREEEGFTFWYFARHPEQLLILPLRTIKYQTSNYFTSYFGKWMGWFEINVGNVPCIVMAFLLFFTVLSENRRIEHRDGRALLRLVGIGEILCIFAAFVLGFSRTSMYYIEGVQGRYLIAPVTTLLITLTGNRRIRSAEAASMEIYGSLFVSAWTLTQILMWYA